MASDKIIDGKKLAEDVTNEIRKKVETLNQTKGVTPGVAVILVGDRPDSSTYVRMKKQACEQVGINLIELGIDMIRFTLCTFPTEVTQEQLIEEVTRLNADSSVHGILVQLPLPSHIETEKILLLVDPEKDVDGFHPIHMGSLAMRGHEPLFVPCTPKGCIELLKRSDIPIAGQHAVVVGRSNLVGIPVALMLMNENATVTICHSRTQNLPDVVRQADIVIAAIGKAEFIKGDWLKEGAVVVDVGINAKDAPELKRGYRLVGDVDYASALERASRITPVPGGVGPMTVAMLLDNTLSSALRRAHKQ